MSGTDLLGRPSKADTGKRNDHDFYETPTWMTRSLLHHHPLRREWTILEPCAGDGAIARVLEAAGHRVITNDVDPRHQTDFHDDATQLAFWQRPALAGVDVVVSNLPFNVAFPIAEQSLLLARIGVALLLRKTFTEPTQERGPWLNRNPPSRQIGLPRHSFRGKGSDSVSTDWFIWTKADNFELNWWPPIVVDHRAKERMR